ncbi:hypothetical protein SOVF_111770 [Spinacia oleracea]|nr:hypothetical protein SOVF_111770 [Spinacia oleracea]
MANTRKQTQKSSNGATTKQSMPTVSKPVRKQAKNNTKNDDDTDPLTNLDAISYDSDQNPDIETLIEDQILTPTA